MNERRVIHKHQRVGGGVREVAGGGRFAVHIVHRTQHPRAYELVGWQGVVVHHRRGGRLGIGLWPLARGEPTWFRLGYKAVGVRRFLFLE